MKMMTHRTSWSSRVAAAVGKGYANGAIARGPTLFVAGQIGWRPERHVLRATTSLEQFAQALDNVIAVVRAAGGAPESVAKMTVYVTDVPAYRGEPQGVRG